MPFDEVQQLVGYEKNARRVVATKRRRPDGGVGFSVELYRRDVRVNRWEEALRIDALPGEAHVHVFEDGRPPAEHDLPSAGDDLTDLAAAVMSFFNGEGVRCLEQVGFAPDLDGGEAREEVVEFLQTRLLSSAKGSPER